ncbi:MAG: hypothetical protein H7X70_00800 [Candidatus Kapabacteria bacterium]|nr:hypothetical protein [Candidatus Kapabacteria bacterium]
MSHDVSHESEHEVDIVEDTIATRFLGIVAGILVVVAAVSIQKLMGWHPISGGVMTGVFGMILGALGTSVRGPIRAAVLGWAGGIAFFMSIAMFVGLRFW